MNALHTEVNRLFFADPQHALLHDATRSPLLGADGHVRCGVLELGCPADWSLLGAVWRGVQTDLELTAPAIAINGSDGYQLWFAWQQALPAVDAATFLQALCQRYLGTVAPARLRYWPAANPLAEDEAAPTPPPAAHPRSGQWSAFIAPDLAAVFADEPWLDRDPGLEAQAQLLGRLEGMGPQDFAKAWALLQPAPPKPVLTPTQATSPSHGLQPAHADYPTDTPTAFLQAVMRDATAPLALRMQAATALLQRDASTPKA